MTVILGYLSLMEKLLFSCPANYFIAGMSNSGKSYWVFKLLQHKNSLFQKPPVKILYCYSIWQPLYEKMENDMDIHFYKGLPTYEDLQKFGNATEHNLICLDDLQHEIANSKTIEKLFTQLCHHLCISVLYITQNLFYQGKCSRTLHLNTSYNILLRNHRNIQQIAILGRQVGLGKKLVEAYRDATERPYGYLVLDVSPSSTTDLQLRTNIFPDEKPVVVYK